MKVIIGNILAIYRKELQGYFVSPSAYAIAGVFWFIAGLFLVTILFDPQQGLIPLSQYNLQAQVDWPYEFLQGFLGGIMGQLALFVLPILSMGLYTEERKRGTLELLATSPITNWAVAIGKLLGVVTFFITILLPLLVCETIVFSAATPPMPLTVPLLGHLGLILLAAGVLSLGMFISSLTDSTILSAILTFGLVLILWVIDFLTKSLGGSISDALGHLSMLKHYSNMVKGIVDTSGLVMFASYIVLGIFLTAQSIEALRFQRS